MGNTNTSPAVDLAIVIDTSDSMGDDATGLSKAAEEAIESARTNCPSDLRVVSLGVEGTWKKTKFDRTVRNYLIQECKVSESKIQGRKLDRKNTGAQEVQEDGARAMQDIANHFDWRAFPHRCRRTLSNRIPTIPAISWRKAISHNCNRLLRDLLPSVGLIVPTNLHRLPCPIAKW